MEQQLSYSMHRVVEALDIPRQSIVGWQAMGALNLLESKPPKRRHEVRRFNPKDVLQLALIKFLISIGIPPRHAGLHAKATLDAFDEYHEQNINEMSLRIFLDGKPNELRFNDIHMPEPASPDAAMTITINLSVIFAHVKQRFTETSPEFKFDAAARARSTAGTTEKSQ